MTESKWLSSADPKPMLDVLTHWWPGCYNPQTREQRCPAATDRKLRLFACACCRQVWDGKPCKRCNGAGRAEPRTGVFEAGPLCPHCHGAGRVGGLIDPRSRRAVEVAEQYADGEATRKELDFAYMDGSIAVARAPLPERAQAHLPARSAYCCCMFSALEAAIRALGVLPPTVQTDLLRCVIGNPFRPTRIGWQSLGNGEFAWRGDWCVTPAVLAIARAICDERRPADLGILADALEEAGCDDAGLLAHLRQVDVVCPACEGSGRDQRESCEGDCLECGGTGRVPSPHALPGCHVVDLIVGKG